MTAGCGWFGGKSKDGAAEAHAAERGGLALEPFVVNLTSAGGQHFLRLTLLIVLPTEHDAERFKAATVTTAELRSAFLELLAQQTADALVTADGKQALKKALIERATTVLAGTKVTDVLFSEFIVQF